MGLHGPAVADRAAQQSDAQRASEHAAAALIPGDVVQFDGHLERSQDDEKFGFVSRPT